MSGRVAYLERTERGFRPGALRLVSERSDELFRCSSDDPGGDRAELARMADWIRERLPRSGGAVLLDILCLDVDGALCSWISSSSAEPGVVAALSRHGGAEGWSGTEETPGADVLGTYAGIAQDSSVQALAPAEPRTEAPAGRRMLARRNAPPAHDSPRQRMAVVAMPDAVARVLLDELDLRGVKVGSVCSLWHAMSAAWDPSSTAHARATGASSNGQEGRVVADSPGVHATILVDPRGRLLWSWSGRGGLLAGGAIRLRTTPGSGDQAPATQVSRSDLSRLAAEWLSWSAQLGAAPSRVTCVIPNSGSEGGGLDAREVGESLGLAWPGALIDLAVDDDPLGTTLRRLAVAGSAAQDSGELAPISPEDPSASLVNLTHRPGRAHFRLYLWTALTLLVAATGIAIVAAQNWMHVSETRDAAKALKEQMRTDFQGLKLGQAPEGAELLTLRKELSRLDIGTRPVAAPEPGMPVLQELETLSFVIGYPGLHLDEIVLDSRNTRPRIVFQVDSIAEGEQLFTALKQIQGSNIIGWVSSFPPGKLPNDKFKGTFTGAWVEKPRVPSEGGGA